MKRNLALIWACLDGALPISLRKETPLGLSLLAEPCLVSTLDADQENAGDILCLSAQIDSRVQAENSIFFCFEGENTDGHLHAAKAVENGAVAVVGTRDPFADEREKTGRGPAPVLLVEDTLRALWRIALLQRGDTRARVVGITGTAGKTTIKEVLATVLSVRGATAKNHKNLNTQIGMALSMINAGLDDQFWVLEAGISEPDDMEELGSLLQPDIGIILNAGHAHAQGLGERGVPWHKARLAAYTTKGGTALVNADYPALVDEVNALPLQDSGPKLLFFSATQPGADCHAAYLGPAPLPHPENTPACGQFRVTVQKNFGALLRGQGANLRAPFIGTYGAENTAAIVSAALLLGLSPDEIQQGLNAARLPEMRFSCTEIAGFTIIDDTYNANPLSSARMIETAHSLAKGAGRPLVLVMGAMGELGKEERELHFQLGANMGKAEPAVIFWHGAFMHEVLAGLTSAHHPCPFVPTADAEEFVNTCNGLVPLCRDAVVLFKGSRANRLETYVQAFAKALEQYRETSGSGPL